MTQSTSGQSLISVLIAAGIVGLIALAIAQLASTQQKSILQARLISSRDNIRNQLDRAASDFRLLKTSANVFLENTALKNCIEGGDCQVGIAQPFQLVDPADSSSTPSQLSGTPSAPQRYSIDGSRCETANDQCPIVVFTTFSATCAGITTGSCSQAQGITVTYTIQQAPNITVSPPLQKIVRSVSATAGGIGVGSSAATCNSANQGTVRFNPALRKLELCDGTYWLAILTAAPPALPPPATPPTGSGDPSGPSPIGGTTDNMGNYVPIYNDGTQGSNMQ